MNIKKLASFTGLFILCLCISCSQSHSNDKSSLTVSEDDHEYKILADYPEQNTEKVEKYLNETIGNGNDISFSNTTIDAQLTLDDGTKVYVINKPGILKINLNKDENSASSYREIKALGEGLKPFLNAGSEP